MMEDETHAAIDLAVEGERDVIVVELAKDVELMREALEALEALLKDHCGLVDSGDCGNWNVEKEEEVIQARAAVTKLEERLLRE